MTSPDNAAQGLMLAIMEPPPGLEEEFSDWYDTEHIPQRRGLPGFLNAARWIALEGFPRSLAAYDLVSLHALQDPEYLAVSGSQSTPWSRRLLARTARAGRMRVEIEQRWPGNAVALTQRFLSRLLVARYPGIAVDQETQATIEVRKRTSTLVGMAQLRVFSTTREKPPELWVLVEFSAPTTLSTLAPVLGQLCGHGADIFNLYAPYDKTGKL